MVIGTALDHEKIYGILSQTIKSNYYFNQKHHIEGTTKDYQLNNTFDYDFKFLSYTNILNCSTKIVDGMYNFK